MDKTWVKNLAFVVFVVVVVGFLTMISGERSNRIPEDANHAVITDPAGCLECHGPGMIAARTAKHPPKDDCMLCHKVKRNRKVN